MKIWLDDERVEPAGWVRTYTVAETIDLLKGGAVCEISLDNDLGQHTLDTGEEGWQVLAWLEEQAFMAPSFTMPIVHIHTANPVARLRMKAILAAIESRQ